MNNGQSNQREQTDCQNQDAKRPDVDLFPERVLRVFCRWKLVHPHVTPPKILLHIFKEKSIIIASFVLLDSSEKMRIF